MSLYDLLKERNLIYQSTDDEKLKELLNGEQITVYTGTV